MKEVSSTSTAAYYGTTARYYDPAYAADSRLVDIPFYVDLAKSINGTVLEVACGTGRVLLPTAREGVVIDGLDFSPNFLEILADKLEAEPAQLRRRVNLFHGDMRTFDLGKVYDLVTLPFRPLQHLFTIEDQLAALRCCNAHLKPGATLAFNVFYPNFSSLYDVGNEQQDLQWVDPLDSSLTVRRFFLRKSVDKLRQFFEGELIFRSYRDSEFVSEERSILNLSYYTYPQIQLLLKATGFEIKEEYGSFDREPISICKEMIIIARKL